MSTLSVVMPDMNEQAHLADAVDGPGVARVPALDAIGRSDLVLPYPERSKRSALRNGVSRGYVQQLNLLPGSNVRYYDGTVIHRTKNVRSITIETDVHTPGEARRA